MTIFMKFGIFEGRYIKNELGLTLPICVSVADFYFSKS